MQELQSQLLSIIKEVKADLSGKKFKKSRRKFCLNEKLAVSLQTQRRKIHESGKFCQCESAF